MELILATGNRHKRDEIQALLPSYRVRIPDDLGVEFDFEETGTTYLENALGKALHLYRKVGMPVLADDSGLSVDSLGGEPGVRSARFGSDSAAPPRDDRYSRDRSPADPSPGASPPTPTPPPTTPRRWPRRCRGRSTRR